MKKDSIFFTITVSFVISMLLVITSFAILVRMGQMRENVHLQKKYFPIVRMFVNEYRHNGLSNQLKNNLEVMNMEVIKDKKLTEKLLYASQTKILFEKKLKRFYTKVLSLDDINYVYMRNRHHTFLLKDNNTIQKHKKFVVLLVFAVILITLIISFITTLKKLYPLKLLKDKVTTLGDENFDFECCDTTKKDEVSQLALEFKKTATKLNDLKESRNVFIRNMMHELKTPITKGKFLIELDDTKDNIQKLKKVFNSLETLINEFASIEELITSSKKNLDKNSYYFEDILDEAIDKLMIDKDSVADETQNIKLFVHFKLFSIAVKNLIDNAIKYGDGKKPIIKTINDDIIIENYGNKLSNDLETYFEPFSKDENKKADSFGLGLYIVFNILKANEYNLEYEHNDGVNKFKCVKVKEKIDI